MAIEALRLLEAAALACAITKGTILEPLRQRGPWLTRELLKCPLCLGWWVGIAFYFWAPAYPRAADLLGFAALTALGAMLIRLVLYQLERPHP